MGQRITRAKAKIEAARIPYRCPPPTCPHASSTSLAVLFLVFNEGYLGPAPTPIPYAAS